LRSRAPNHGNRNRRGNAGEHNQHPEPRQQESDRNTHEGQRRANAICQVSQLAKVLLQVDHQRKHHLISDELALKSQPLEQR
jgi:hypothetical protein